MYYTFLIMHLLTKIILYSSEEFKFELTKVEHFITVYVFTYTKTENFIMSSSVYVFKTKYPTAGVRDIPRLIPS